MSVSGYNELISKLDEFIRKYYKNLMIRGAIYCVALIMGAYLLVALLEYFGKFSIPVRTVLFYTFIISVSVVLYRFFIVPLSKMYKLGNTISHEQAAEIIGTHFTEVQDKLINTLQLKKQADLESNNSLLQAGIDQKIASLKPVPFASAIDLGQNKKYLKFAIPPVALFLILLFAAPSILKKSTERLIKYNQEIADEAPFKIDVLNESLTIPENADIKVNIEVSGEKIPDKVYVVIEGQQFLLEKQDARHFSYDFKNVREDLPFNFYASDFASEMHEIKVLPVPGLVNFSAQINYPAYTKRQNETIKNTGDLTIPEGTTVIWDFATKNATNLNVRYADSTYQIDGGGEHFTFKKVIQKSTSYEVLPSNEYIHPNEGIAYRINVVPDLFPTISIEESRDSASMLQMYFTGDVKDDYGFKRLTFNYEIQKDGKSQGIKSMEIPVNRDNVFDTFFFDWNLKNLAVEAGDKLTYYFEIWDNDGVHGSKSSKSAIKEYAVPTAEELEEMMDQKNEDIKDKLEDSMKDAKKIEKDLEELRKQLLEKKEMTWQDKKKLEELLQRQEELRKQIEDIQKENQQKNNQQNELQQQEENILEKQMQLEKLMEEIMNPEMEEMMKELQRLMEELNKDEIQKELDKMDLSTEDMEKELDRALEQFKQLEFEQKMEQTIDKLEKLAEKQEELSKESEKKDANSEELEKKQDELNKEFEEIQKDKEELEKLNEELENPNEVPDTEQKEQEIQQEQQDSKEQLEKNKKSGASKSQKKAADKMKEMAQQMQMSMQSGESQQQEEDMEALRALLENIITLSFDQESLMSEFKSVDIKDPKYNKLGQTQRKLKDDAKMVEDSLFALSKRVPQISAAVNREINQINENMDQALGLVPDRRTPEITVAQQYAMTSFNNLALMLDEALKQMQNQASCSKPGQGNCEKPGGNGKKPKPSAGDLKKMQESLSKQLEEMKKNGQNKGDNKGGKGEMSKQLAEMAAKQAAIRKMMEDKASDLNQDGSGNGNELKQIAKDMEQLQKDIVNNKIDENTIRRQQDIMIRLLKAEDAERKRDQDNQRKSNEAKDYPSSNPEKYEEYIRKKQQETELLRTVPPELKPYYKEKVNEYFNKIGSN